MGKKNQCVLFIHFSCFVLSDTTEIHLVHVLTLNLLTLVFDACC